MKSAQSLGAAQAARLISLPEKISAPNPLKEALLEPIRERNAFLDYIFYDLGTLHRDEVAQLAPGYAREGAILLVQPSGRGGLRLWQDFDAFQAEAHRGMADCIAVAGVGSSALGTAAFARNVADAIDGPVLGVVSGYGLADLFSESLGGFFWFGWVNAVRHAFEPLDAATRMMPSSLEVPNGQISMAIRRSLDVKTLLSLLGMIDVSLLVGHSKGNLVISEALFALLQHDPARAGALAQNGRIVTFSAKIAMPKPWTQVVDVMGELDGFGLMNSRPMIGTDRRVKSAWHHTNTELLFHLPVTQVLRGLL
ncbi:hypothetical protein ACEUZ9_002440 [Paracoccus litorisediminis]|uniref:Alpha/beta hydrolase n=1 Tax=Paracoccus litorisediminis TaxID=2006130 RepID=A0A844HMH0_9RHOB|nr:hypothetical protein [Paracoccus litorisediminis]MTH59567.1 hypothetical protein [Paracoccus litorisediminis]